MTQENAIKPDAHAVAGRSRHFKSRLPLRHQVGLDSSIYSGGAAGRRDRLGHCSPGVAARVLSGAAPVTSKGYQIRKFPDLDIIANAGTSVTAKTLFTPKAF
jgi:hypothetical protein